MALIDVITNNISTLGYGMSGEFVPSQVETLYLSWTDEQKEQLQQLHLDHSSAKIDFDNANYADFSTAESSIQADDAAAVGMVTQISERFTVIFGNLPFNGNDPSTLGPVTSAVQEAKALLDCFTSFEVPGN